MTDYERGWTQWGDMIRYSPAPFHRRRLIMKLADEVPFESALDVGCGNGELLLALSRRRPLRRLVGVDIAASVIDENRRTFPDFEFHHLDIGSGSLPLECDLVICSEVIEHVVAWEQALVHLRRMCATHLIVTVPAGRMFPIDRLMGHHRHFALETLSEALGHAGFVPERARRWGFPFHTAYKHLINLAPDASVRRFSTGVYGPTTKAIATLIRWLFYLNSRHLGSQLVIRARVVDGSSMVRRWPGERGP